MGHILNSINAGDWCIEHRTNYRWYLFDINKRTDGRIELLWAQDFELCLCWSTKEMAYDFLDAENIPQLTGRCLNKLYLRKK